ncbi:MAG: hypothetical protein KGZ96_12445 [Clostridia bacterium]|nr:hypothetical protein [Clostridia bacterium]
MEKLPKKRMFDKPVIWTTDASGAAVCAQLGFITVIIDVIDMSTSLEACRYLGASLILGASPVRVNCPVKVAPAKVAGYALKYALENGKEILIVTEPRHGKEWDREENAAEIISIINNGGGKIAAIVPNIGGEIGELAEIKDRVVIGVTATGGTAFDAAFNILADQRVTTATVARVKGQNSHQLISATLSRITHQALNYNTGVAFIAASRNSMEDILAAQYLAQQLTLHN